MDGDRGGRVSIKEKMSLYRQDPEVFVREILKGEPTKQQIELLQAVAKPGAKVSVRSGHGTGKTTTMAWLVLWFLCTRKNVKIPCTAPTQAQLRDVLWAEIAKWRERMPDWWREQVKVKNERVEIAGAEKSQFAVARTAKPENPDALQGFHADQLLFIIDEASGVYNKIFEVARGALSTASARVVMCGNPTQTTGYFYESHHRSREEWERLHFSCLDSPLVDSVYPESMAREYGKESDVYRVRVLGEFPKAASNQLIPIDWIEEAMDRSLRPEQIAFAPKIIGVDVAPYGGDRSAIFLRQGLYSELLWQKVGVDDLTIGGIVANFAREKQVDGIFIDQGAGSGVGSALRHMGFSPVLAPFGAAPSNSRYLNKRAEMWDLMKQWIKEGGVLPKLSDLKDDLIGPQYFYGMTGKLQLERKEDMKKRGIASPDLADALALTFAYPVAMRGGNQGESGEEWTRENYKLLGNF